MTNQRTKRALIGFTIFSVVCLVLVVIAWQSPARHLWRIRLEFTTLASFPYSESDKLIAVRCLAAQNDPHALPLARTVKEPDDKVYALCTVAKATNDSAISKEALGVARTAPPKDNILIAKVVIAHISKDSGLLNEIFLEAKTSTVLHDRAHIFTAIAHETKDSSVLRKVFDAIKNGIEPSANFDISSVIAEVAEKANTVKDAQFLNDMLITARTITEPTSKARALVSIANAMKNPIIFNEALRAVRYIASPDDTEEKVTALAELAGAMKNPSLLNEALHIARAVTQSDQKSPALLRMKSEALIRIAEVTEDSAILKEALDTAKSIVFLPYLPPLFRSIAIASKSDTIIKELLYAIKDIKETGYREYPLERLTTNSLSHQLFRNDPVYRKELVAMVEGLKSAELRGAIAYDYAYMGYLAEARGLVQGNELERLSILSAILDGINRKPYRDYFNQYSLD